jgi:hypothetical protein
MEQLQYFLQELKDGEKFKQFISQCWLTLPSDFPNLLENYQDVFEKFAQKLSTIISNDPHMLPINAYEIMTAFLERQSYFIN